MVNYEYDLEQLAANRESYLGSGSIAHATELFT
jgi:hypothetical protein